MLLVKQAVGPFEMNCYFVGCERTRHAFVVDPGEEIDRLLASAKKDKLVLTRLLCTHAHIDHIGAAAEMKKKTGLELSLHKEDLFWVDLLPDQGRMFGFPPYEKPAIEHYLEDAEEFDLDDLHVKVLHCPGHTPGGCAFLVKDRAAEGPMHLFSGDVLFAGSIGRTDFPRGDFDTIVKSIRSKLFTLPDDTIVHPGHGPDTTIRDERLHNPFVGERAGR